MSDITFSKRFINIHNTVSIDIKGCEYELTKKDLITGVKPTRYNYKRVILKHSDDCKEAFKRFEKVINEYLVKEDLPEIEIFTDDKLNIKLEKIISRGSIRKLVISNIYIDIANRGIPQIWATI